MSHPLQSSERLSDKALFVQMALSAWQTQNTRLNELLGKLSDEQLATEVAPNRNRGIYLLGHLTAVNDGLFPLFELGEKLYPELEALFVKNPDKAGLAFPSPSQLKHYWQQVNANLSRHFEGMQPDDWFARHSAVSPADFAKEPHRNKLNVLLNRTSHQSYHLGQLILLSP